MSETSKNRNPDLCAVRFDSLGHKLGILNFLNRLLAEAALHFLGGKRNRIAVGTGRGAGKSPGNVFLDRGRDFGAVHRDQLGFHAGQLNRLVAVIGDDHENWQKTEFTVVNRKDVRLVRQIIGIDRRR